MSAGPDAPEARGDAPADGAGRERIPGNWIAVSLAAIVVCGAALGIVQTDAGVNESNTARETTRTAVGALRAGVLEEAARQLERDIVAESRALERRQEALAARAEAAGGAATTLTLDQLRGRVEEGSDLPRARTEAEVRRLAFEATRLRLTQTALAETRVTWNTRSTQYTTAIAMLTVALFLVGFALVLQGARRTLFYLLGIAFGLVVLGWAGRIYSLPIPSTPAEAVAATARGTVEAEEGRQEAAIADFSAAIEIDRDYESAYDGRATATFLAANPDFRQTGAVTGDPEALDAAVADARTALDLGGGRDFSALVLLALLGLYSGEYDLAVEAADDAIAINGDVPDIRLLQSAAEVGRGDDAAAGRSFEEALRLVSGTDPSGRTRGLAAQYLTHLEQVAATTPGSAGAARALARRMVTLETGFNLGRTLPGSAPERGSVTVEGLGYRDGTLRLRLRWRDLPTDTAVTAIGFERPRPGAPWVQPRDLALFRTLSGDGEEALTVPVTRACAPADLRVDLHLDGAPAGSVTAPGVPPTC
jgi:tetratricopeptide (TPR) repeat protein